MRSASGSRDPDFGRRISTRYLSPPVPLLLALVAILVVEAAPARAQFGKNKVQYEEFDFRVLKTEHFDIHYYPEADAAVLDAARMAERAYTRLSKVFRHEWEDRKPLILYASQSDFQQTNIFRFQISEGIAGVTEGLRNRIVLFFPSAYPEFEHTLTHELVHAFQFDILRRGALSQGSNPFAFRMPLWFAEGMAEYLTVGEIDPLTAMWLRDASMAGYLTTIDELSRVGDIRVYRFGQALWYYIGTKYGDEKIGEIMQKAPLIGVQEAFKTSLNLTLDELSEDWLEAIRLTYLPQVVEYPRAQEAAVRLTDHVEDGAAINVGPALSPDGSKVAFVSDRDFFNDLYIADATDGGDVDKVVKGERSASFESLRFLRVGMSFSPDGRFLAFSSRVGERDALYIMRVEDEKIVDSHRFEELEGIETPSWSPTGQELVFTGQSGGTSDLYVVGRDGSGLRRLNEDRYAQRDPVWSPDGTRIAFTTDFGPGTDFDLLAYGQYQIGVYELGSGRVTFLPDQQGKNINPQWGPDGKTLAFLSDRTGISNIFLYDFEKDETYQLTDLLTGVSGIIESSPALAWSRDGSRIVFSAFSDAGWDLYRIDDPLDRPRAPYEAVEQAEYDLAASAFVRPARPAALAEGERDFGRVVGAEPLAVGTGEGGEPDDQEPDEPQEGAGEAQPTDAVSHYLGQRQPATRRDVAPGRRLPSFRDPVDIATLLSDPTIGLPRDTTRFENREYKVSLAPDMISQPEVGFATGIGAFGASQLAFSDLLGDHNLYVAASVFGSLTDSDLFLTYANLKKRLNWGATAFQFRSDFLPLSTGGSFDDPFFRSDIYRGAQVFAAYPFSRFRRLELGGSFTYVDRREVRFNPFDLTPDVSRDLPDDAFLSPSIAYVYDTAFFGSTGPIGGSRQRLEWQRAFGDRTFNQFYGDVRKYWLFDRRWTFASRLLFLGTYGQEGDNLRLQSIGGPTLLRGYDFREDSLVGSQIGLLNLEFRFPIVERPVLGGAGFPPIRGAIWYDLGFASCGNEQCPHLRPRVPEEGELSERNAKFRFSTSEDAGPLGFRLVDAKAAFGAGVRMNLLGFAVLRLDYALQTDMAEVGDGRWVFTLAPEF
ncbi:MAG TPA: DPP IV N-terminal domain-containing protein [Gemmatimonadota bacterium]|nr:DPP IV N-terminal domain-containing protein [Gemmatimonadota bacterium]